MFFLIDWTGGYHIYKFQMDCFAHLWGLEDMKKWLGKENHLHQEVE